MTRRRHRGTHRPVGTIKLTKRQLNRATLARQMLLAREAITPAGAVERLAGLQAQQARPPFIGLWTRLESFERSALVDAFGARTIVRGPAMRATIHMMTAKDFIAHRSALQPGLTRGMKSVLRKRSDDLDIDALVANAASWFEDAPRPFKAFRDHLEATATGDIRAMAYAVRTALPLVQVPSDSDWGFKPTADFTTAASWLGRPIRAKPNLRSLVKRYLGAFGPASTRDFETWSGLFDTTPVFEAMRDQLVVFEDDAGRTVFDLRDAPRPPGDVAAPVRLLPDYDNLVLAHQDRTRVISAEHSSAICTKNLRILPTYLVDGFVAGTWDLKKTGKTAKVIVTPFARTTKKTRASIEHEAQGVLRFCEPDAKSHIVEFAGSI